MAENEGTGTLQSIWTKRGKQGPMDPQSRARLDAGSGLAGNADQGGHRQVTIIELEKWREMMIELGTDLDPSTRRANLMVVGLKLTETRGRVLRVGGCRLRILGETRPCRLMDESYPGLEEAMKSDGRGGVYAEVLDNGEIATGDVVRWDDDATNAASH